MTDAFAEQFLASPSPVWEIASPDPCMLLALAGSEDDGPIAAIARIDAYLAAHNGGSVLPIEDLGGEGATRWSVAIRVPKRANAIVLFAEDPKEFLENAPHISELSNAGVCVGISTPLESPFVEDFVALARLLEAATGGMLALVDPALDAVFAREHVQGLFLDAEPLADERTLFRTQIVTRKGRDARWIFTEGMARIGKPDFEMLEVAPTEERSAITLVEIAASLFFAAQLPPPETPIELGTGVSIALVTPQEALEGVDAHAAGSARDRTGEKAHFQPRKSAVISAPAKRGAYRQVWTRPVEAIAALQQGVAELALPDGIRRSTARKARQSWKEVIARRSDAAHAETTLAQVNVGINGIAEHAWLEVIEASALGGAGVLLHPLRDNRLSKGERVEFRLDQVSDWSGA